VPPTYEPEPAPTSFSPSKPRSTAQKQVIVLRVIAQAGVILQFLRVRLSCRSRFCGLSGFLIGVSGGVCRVARGRCGRGDRVWGLVRLLLTGAARRPLRTG
jgi:hypothetical protein